MGLGNSIRDASRNNNNNNTQRSENPGVSDNISRPTFPSVGAQVPQQAPEFPTNFQGEQSDIPLLQPSGLLAGQFPQQQQQQQPPSNFEGALPGPNLEERQQQIQPTLPAEGIQAPGENPQQGQLQPPNNVVVDPRGFRQPTIQPQPQGVLQPGLRGPQFQQFSPFGQGFFEAFQGIGNFAEPQPPQQQNQQQGTASGPISRPASTNLANPGVSVGVNRSNSNNQQQQNNQLGSGFNFQSSFPERR